MKLILLATLLVATTMSVARAQDDNELKEFNIKQFKGWTGIVLRCQPATSNQDVADAICENAALEFNYLAESSGIPHKVSRNENSFLFHTKNIELENPLTLELTTSATANANVLAVHVQISAENFYIDVVAQDAGPGHPEALPRSGNLVLWERSVMAVGDRQVVEALTPYVKDHIKAFFTEFLPGWNAK